MAEISSLLTLQGQLALLTLIGFFLARKGFYRHIWHPPLFDVVGITFPIDSQVNMAVPKSNDRSLCDIGAFPVEREIANRQSFALLSQEKHQTPVCDEFSATAVDY